MAATALLDSLEVAAQSHTDRWDDKFYEVVDGKRMVMPPMSYYAGIVASKLSGQLNVHLYAQHRPAGNVVVEVLFRLPLAQDASRNRRPDIAFVSDERWPIDRPKSSRANAWDVVPDLTVEVISPNDFAQEQLEKVLEYFEVGVRLVWVVYPEQRHVCVYESPTKVRVLTSDDTLDGGVVLPGFQLRLDRLFDPVVPTGNGIASGSP